MTDHRARIRTWMLLTVGALMALNVGACAQQPSAASTSPGAPAVAANVALILQADTVLGTKNLTADEKPQKSCVQASRFARNEEIVWRVKVVDPATGQPMADKSLSSVELRLPDQTLKLKYGGHPSTTPTDSFWSVSWTVPASYPTGSLPYTVAATAIDGRTGSFEQFKVTPSVLTITDQVRTPLVASSAAPSAVKSASPSAGS